MVAWGIIVIIDLRKVHKNIEQVNFNIVKGDYYLVPFHWEVEMDEDVNDKSKMGIG